MKSRAREVRARASPDPPSGLATAPAANRDRPPTIRAVASFLRARLAANRPVSGLHRVAPFLPLERSPRLRPAPPLVLRQLLTAWQRRERREVDGRRLSLEQAWRWCVPNPRDLTPGSRAGPSTRERGVLAVAAPARAPRPARRPGRGIATAVFSRRDAAFPYERRIDALSSRSRKNKNTRRGFSDRRRARLLTLSPSPPSPSPSPLSPGRPGRAPRGRVSLPGIRQALRALHTQTTPLWRNGPDGPKTLCNACGVRDNRRQNKSRDQANRQRPRKPATTTGDHATTARAKHAAALAAERAAAAAASDDASAGRRSARWNAGLLAKRAKAAAEADAAERNAKRRRGAGAPLDAGAKSLDVDPHSGEIFLPVVREIPEREYALDAPRAFAPPARYVSSRRPGLAGRFGAGGPAPLYDATKEDVAWLAEVNADGRDACDALGTRQLERLFDSFEEASWHSGETPASAAHAYEILGYSSGASVAEAEAAVKAANAGMMMGLEGLERELIGFADEGDLLAPGTDANAADAAAWDLVRGTELETGSLPRARSPGGGARSDRSYTPPTTPSGSFEPGTDARGGMSSKASDDGSDGSGRASPPSSAAGGDTDAEDASDDGSDARRGGGFDDESGNGKSSYLAVSAGFATKGKTGTASGAARVTRAALRRRVRTDPGVATPAVADPLEVRERTSELDETVTDKRGAFFGGAKKNQRRAARRGDAGGIGRGALAPSAADAEAAFARYAELRAKNGGAALHPRFARPAPARVRGRARLGAGAHAGDENAGDENPGDDDATRGAEDDDRLATRASDYQFVLGFEGVRRHSGTRGARGGHRRRRAQAQTPRVLNPAASKRRRKHQAEMEVAIEAPLTIVYEPLFAEDVAEDVAYAGATPVSAPARAPRPSRRRRRRRSSRIGNRTTTSRSRRWFRGTRPPRTRRWRRSPRPSAGSPRRSARRSSGAGGGQDGGGRVQDGGGRVRAVGDAQVATAASSVLSRFIGAKPAPADAGFPVLSPSTPKKRRTPRFGGDRGGEGSARVAFLRGENNNASKAA